jgi:hypothetical protein
MSPPSGGDEEALLVAALRGDERAGSALERRFRPLLGGLARRWCPDLPVDIQNEIAQEVWAAIWSRNATRSIAGYDPGTQTATNFIASFVPNAAQRVRAAYRAPGTVSRARRSRRIAPTIVPRSGWDAPMASTLEVLEPLVPDPGWERETAVCDARLDVARAAKVATPTVALGITLMLDQSATMSDAARAAGLAPSTFTRRLSELAKEVQVAA